MKIKFIENARVGEPDYCFECLGCGCLHGIWVSKKGYNGPAWDFNKDLEKPTINPSILVREPTPSGMKICHSFVRDGKIQYLSDCTHDLAGQTIELPEI